jgi:hypothetical protein
MPTTPTSRHAAALPDLMRPCFAHMMPMSGHVQPLCTLFRLSSIRYCPVQPQPSSCQPGCVESIFVASASPESAVGHSHVLLVVLTTCLISPCHPLIADRHMKHYALGEWHLFSAQHALTILAVMCAVPQACVLDWCKLGVVAYSVHASTAGPLDVLVCTYRFVAMALSLAMQWCRCKAHSWKVLRV